MQASSIPPTHGFWNLPVNAARHGHVLDAQLLLNLWIALALLALAHLILFIGLARRKRSRTPSLLLVEYLPIAAFTILLAALATHSERLWATQRFTGADLSAMQVEVTGMQFVWYFRYPGTDAAFGTTRLALASAANANPLGIDPTDPHGRDDIVTSQLVLPANREVDLTLHAQDVIHGFSVPQLRLKQDATPGTTTHIHFTPETPGDYAILCTQVCGLGHYRMQAILRVLPPAAFDAWLHTQENLHAQENLQAQTASTTEAQP
ncbi:MAG: cytochrome C oxidase subunit II [Acidobacteria bacterium]|nr:cytochrome C oxidase subunit II [Acidobacteriota bacterium]